MHLPFHVWSYDLKRNFKLTRFHPGPRPLALLRISCCQLHLLGLLMTSRLLHGSYMSTRRSIFRAWVPLPVRGSEWDKLMSSSNQRLARRIGGFLCAQRSPNSLYYRGCHHSQYDLPSVILDLGPPPSANLNCLPSKHHLHIREKKSYPTTTHARVLGSTQRQGNLY